MFKPKLPSHDASCLPLLPPISLPRRVAARMGYVEILRILLEAGADQGAQDRHRHTALWYSVKYDRRAAATILRAARQEAEERGGARPAASGSSIIRDTCGHR